MQSMYIGIAHLDIRPANVFISELHPNRMEQISGSEIYGMIELFYYVILLYNYSLFVF
jgi:hypothetical protein